MGGIYQTTVVRDRSWVMLDGDDRGDKSRAQRITVQLRSNNKVSLFKNSDGRYQSWFDCDLQGTTVDPGSLLIDSAWGRGWFIESIGAEMGFAQNPHGIERIQSAPKTDEMRATATSSISYNLGFGFFGLQGTGSTSMTISNSYSYSLTDFDIVEHSTAEKITQFYDLTATPIGRYEVPRWVAPPEVRASGPLEEGGTWATEEIYNPGPNQLHPADTIFQGLHHDELPARATSSFQLGSQGLFLARARSESSPVPFDGTAVFEITLSVQMRWLQQGPRPDAQLTPEELGRKPSAGVVGWNQEPYFIRSNRGRRLIQTWEIPVDFSKAAT